MKPPVIQNDIQDSRFVVRNNGLWFDDGKSQQRRLSDAFVVAGKAYDNSRNPHYVIEHNGEYFSIAWEELGERIAWKTLRRHIRRLPTAYQDKQLIIEYLQTRPLEKIWQLTDTAGWHGNAYVLPNGEILGKKDNVLFKNPNLQDGSYSPKGCLQDWQREIGQYLAGNSRLCLFVGAAFASPLLKWFNLDGGILHIYGQSSSGKSTAQRVALSVWGHGKDAGHSWNATGYALTNAAASRSDGLLSLDEIGEDSKQAIETCAYTIANGRGRLQGAKDGGNRPDVRFRVLAVSSGETTLKAHFNKGGRSIMAGQIVRCPSIPHELEMAHNFKSLKSFTDHLNQATVTYYGVAGRAFIAKLISNRTESKDSARWLYDQFMEELHSDFVLTSQMSRTAKLFAISAVGLMLASEWGVSGISAIQARQGLKKCFEDWYKEQPQGDIEDMMFREQVINKFPELLGLFVPIEFASNLQSYPRDYVGFVQKGDKNTPDIYDMLPAKFYEIFDCHERSSQIRAYRILGDEMKWLIKPSSGRSWQHNRRVNGSLIRVFRFRGLFHHDF